MSDFKYTLSAVAIMKYEEPYVAEWVAFHKVCGIQHFYIYDNNENSLMAGVLDPFIQEGTVTLIPMYGEVKMFEAYNAALVNYDKESKYLAYFDADEFIVSSINKPIYQTVDELFTKFSDKWFYLNGLKPGGIGINWKVYGTSGHQTKPEGLVTKNYTLRGETEQNNHIKSIVNPRLVTKISNPHFASYKPGCCCISQKGSQISGPFFPDESDYPLRINHYFYKSVEEFKFRLNRKKADIKISERELSALIAEQLANAQKYNKIRDTLAWRYCARTEEELRSKGYKIS